ncbi:hypothetical protein AGMMS49957_10390 [Synergistales bacterium]|nr:hypothetical protein AGMMS49957_10390 [Synergistales bacterium]
MADETKVIIVNKGSTTEWANQVRPLEQGEFGYDSDTKELKIGDGVKTWEQLPNRIAAQVVTSAEYDALTTKDTSTLYLINAGGI